MKARYSYRFYPTKGQQTQLAQLFGCCRVVWNDALALCRQSEKLPKNSDLQKLFITAAKKTEARQWLSEVSNIPLQQSINDLGVAYRNFFKSLKGERKGPKMGVPQFKKRASRQTARFRRGGFSLKGRKVYLAKIGQVKVKWSRSLPENPSSVTVIKDSCGHYFLSFVVEIEPKVCPWLHESVGLDLNIKAHHASNGERFSLPKFDALARKIRRFQRRWSRQVKGSKRREQTRLKIAKLKAKRRNILKDFLHKVSTQLIRENQAVVLEDLNVSGMVKNRRLARAISESGFGLLRAMLEAKAKQYVARQAIIISRWEPTSQVCSCCGYRWGKLDLSIREVQCLNCGTVHNRDDNAAANIDKAGVGQLHRRNKRAMNGHKTGGSGNPTASLSHGKEMVQLALPV